MVHELSQLRDRTHVFKDRRHAGEVLARMLAGSLPAGARILAIPAGGVPVAAAMAKALRLQLDVAVVSKITPAWHSEVGYGAVAFDGRVRVDAERMAQLGVDEQEAREDVDRTVAKVRRRVQSLRAGRGPIVAPGEVAVLVDDGLASGLTMVTAAEAVRDAGAGRIVVAVPTGSESSVRRLAAAADEVHCSNVRTGPSFAVADAYQSWSDLDDAAVLEILNWLRDEGSS
jgi:predicted phosphoribosyltransferase